MHVFDLLLISLLAGTSGAVEFTATTPPLASPSSTSSVSTRTPVSWLTTAPSTTSLKPLSTSTPTPTTTSHSTSSFSFTPIQPSASYTGPICKLLPLPNPDPFVAVASNPQVASLYLTYNRGVAGLGKKFSSSWTYGPQQAVGAWYPQPCGYAYLNIRESGYSWKHLTFDGTSSTTWNATVGSHLTSLSSSLLSQNVTSSDFMACQTLNDLTTSPSKTWYLFLQTGLDIPTETATGDVIYSPSCVSAKMLVDKVTK